MKVIRPENVTDATLTSSNISETELQWLVGTTYAIGDVRRGPAGPFQHTLYQSLINSNLGHDPTTDDGTRWIQSGTTNKWAMFDSLVQTQSTRADNITVVLDPVGRIDSIALFNTSCASVTVTVTDAVEGVVFNQTFSMVSDSGVDTWYEWFFEPIDRVDRLLVNLPPYYSPTISVSFNAAGETVKVGAFAYGFSKDIGDTQYGASVGIQDYSRKEADVFGNFEIVERAYADTGNFTVILNTTSVDSVRKLLATYRATPVVYVGSDLYASTMIYGFFQEFAIEFTVFEKSTCTIRIEGLT